MKRFVTPSRAYLLLLAGVSGSCSFKTKPSEPRTLKAVSARNVVQDEAELNTIYSYLVFQYHNNRGEIEEARKALDVTLAYDGESSELKLEQAEDLYSRGLYASARELLLQLRDKNSEAEKLFIQVLVREGNISEARVALDKWLETNKKDEDFYALRVRIELEDQNLASAEKILKHFVADIPDSSQAYLLHGKLRQLQNKPKDALSDYKTALELDPQNVTAAAHLAFLQDLVGQREDAVKTYAWLADLTDNPEFHKRLGNLYLERSDSRRAIAALEAYARHQPNDSQNTARLAALYIDLKDYEQAEYKLQDLLKKQPDNETLRYYYAAALFESNQKAKALEQVKHIKRESNLFPERLRIELESLWDLGQEGHAKKVAENFAGEVMKLTQKKDEEVYTVLYNFMSQKKMRSIARELLGKGLENFPKNTQLRYSTALALDEEGKSKEALFISLQLLKEDGKNPAVQNLVAYLLANQGSELKRAEKLVEAALKARPQDPYIMDSKAWIRFKQNKLGEALALLEEVQKVKPDEPVILVHLADVLAKMGRIQDAVSWYEKALSLGIDAPHDRARVQEIVSQNPKDAKSANRKISCVPGTLCPP